MVLLKILSGKKAGAEWVARRFPVRIGRSPSADLQLEDEGVWNEHLVLRFMAATGLKLEAQGDALATVNGEPVHEAVLRNGDEIGVGSARLQFWLGEARQKALGVFEALTWTLVIAVMLAQVVLLYWLLG